MNINFEIRKQVSPLVQHVWHFGTIGETLRCVGFDEVIRSSTRARKYHPARWWTWYKHDRNNTIPLLKAEEVPWSENVQAEAVRVFLTLLKMGAPSDSHKLSMAREEHMDQICRDLGEAGGANRIGVSGANDDPCYVYAGHV